MEDSITITDTLDLTLSDWTWSIAEQNRAAIESYFATLRVAKPSLWNGRVLLLSRLLNLGQNLSRVAVRDGFRKLAGLA